MHFVDAKGILSARNGMNIYRGCTHGCIYCDSRSTCYRLRHAFTDIEVKQNAPQLLEAALRRKRKKCMIATGSMSDPYLPCEQELRLSRQCFELIERYGFGLSVLTKSSRILRDVELLGAINEKAKCVAQLTLTTFDEDLCRVVEPNVSTTAERYRTLKVMQDNAIPTVVWLSPLLPFINDTEENLRGLLDLCFDAGVRGIICFGIGLTLRDGDREYFYAALDEHFPGLKQRYVHAFGNDYECHSKNNAALMRIFEAECVKHGVMHDVGQIFHYLSEFPAQPTPVQLELFQDL